MYLGLDLGKKTLGVAKSDPFNLFAYPLKIINHDNDFKYLAEELKKLCEEYKIEKLILGYPINMDDSVGERGKYSEKFKKYLEKEGFSVELVDERLSTKEAETLLIQADISRAKRKEAIDKVAATIILDRYLKRGG